MTDKTQSQIDENYKFYKENINEIHNKYGNKYIIISDKKIIKDFLNFEEAYKFWMDEFWIWNFIVQSADYESSIQYLSRLSFA